MSDTSEALPPAHLGTGIGTVVRLLAIALGIMSALALARDGLGFKLIPFLDAVITAYGIFFDDLFKDIVLALVEPLFALLRRWFDWHLQLYPHWKHVFVLLWLFFSSYSRSFRQGLGLYIWVWGGLCAVSAGVLAGTVPIDHSLVFLWPVAGISLFWLHLLRRRSFAAAREDGRSYLPAMSILMRRGLFVGATIAFALAGAIPFLLAPESATTALLSLSMFVCLWAALFLVLAARDARIGAGSWWKKFINQELMRVGLDIFAVLGGAAFIVWLGNALAGTQ